MNLIILKIGGSLITKKTSGKPVVDKKNLRRICKEIATGYNKRKNKLILIHGAGSFGHPAVAKSKIDKGIKNAKQIIAWARVLRAQNELNAIVCTELQKAGIAAAPVQAAASALMSAGRLKSMDVAVIKKYLSAGLVPVLYGVPAFDKEQGCSILSGDEILVYLAKKLKAVRAIHATSVDGVFSADPNLSQRAQLVKKISARAFKKIKKGLAGSSAVDVTGGMSRKVELLFEIFSASPKTVCEIISGKKAGYIKRALQGERGLGTIITNR